MRGGGLDKIQVSLASIVPVPNWLDRRLNYAYKQRYKAQKRGDQRLLDWAEREIAKLKAKGGI